MHPVHKRLAFVLLGLRALVDLALAALLYQQLGSLLGAVGLLLICAVFYGFLYAGLRNEVFYGRHGREVSRWGKPLAYWRIVGCLVLFHLGATLLMGQLLQGRGIQLTHPCLSAENAVDPSGPSVATVTVGST